MSNISNPSHPSPDLGALLESSGAVLHGHFLLSSGRHSEVYFEKFRVLEQPHVLTALCQDIASKFSTFNIDVVAGPTTGGIIIAFDVARYLGCSAVYVERENGERLLRRGAAIPAGARVLVVDDVLTTGLSVHETISCIEKAGGKVVGVGVLIDRAQEQLNVGVPLMSAYRVEAQSYDADDLPEWLASVPITKPGTRPGL